MKIVIKYLEYLNEKVKVFEPNNYFVIYYNYLMVIIELIAAFYLPMEISFMNKDFKLPQILSQLILLFFFFDIVILFNTGSEDKGIEIFDRKTIAKMYIKGNFFFDLLAFIALIFTMSRADSTEIYCQDIFGFFTILKISHVL